MRSFCLLIRAFQRCAGCVRHLASEKHVEVLLQFRGTGRPGTRIEDVLPRGTGCGSRS
jgi:hypothetical protein